MTKMANLSRLRIIAVILVYSSVVPAEAAEHAPSIDEEVLYRDLALGRRVVVGGIGADGEGAALDVDHLGRRWIG